MSHGAAMSRPVACSGAMYVGVPQVTPSSVSLAVGPSRPPPVDDAQLEPGVHAAEQHVVGFEVAMEGANGSGVR